MRAPFPYAGGKSRIASTVWDRFGDVPNFVEPFFGSGAVLLARPTPGRIETVNDADAQLANFWRAVKHDSEGVAEWADDPVNECVPAGTIIATPNGDVPIESITPEMVIWGHDGDRVVATKVIDTKQSITKSALVRIGQLRLTGNHPVWTPNGYLDAWHLSAGHWIGLLANYNGNPVDEPDLCVLELQHGSTEMGDIHTIRPTRRVHSLRGDNISREGTVQGTSFEGNDRRENLPGLLDTFVNNRGNNANLSGGGRRHRRWLSRSRTVLDHTLQKASQKTYKSNGRRRRNTGLYANTGTALEVVVGEEGSSLSAGPCSGNVGEAPHRRGAQKNRRSWKETDSFRRESCKDVSRSKKTRNITLHDRSLSSSQARKTPQYRILQETQPINSHKKGGDRSGNKNSLRINSRSCKATGARRANVVESKTKRHKRIHKKGPSVLRASLGICLTVYNFQTTTGNYFANGILVHNCDLHARHAWLMQIGKGIVEQCLGDPDFYDAKCAGWWLWGICQWIGSGWCSGNGPWRIVDGKLVNTGEPGGNRCSLPYLSTAGMGINRKRPHLGDAGMGINRQLPHLGGGRGINRGTADTCAERTQALLDTMHALCDRLRNVRVCCGDWTRVLGPCVTERNGITGIFLDPPYSHAERDSSMYACETDCSSAVREWAIANGDNPMLRLALCGYSGEHDMPSDWECHAWKSGGGYGSQDNGRGRENAKRERIWFSPHCLRPTLFGLEEN